MIVPYLAVPIAVSFLTVADQVPKLDVAPSCKGAAAAGYFTEGQERLKACMDSEQRTREDLEKKWTGFPAADRTWCVASIKGFEPTYTELATCLEMKRDVRTGTNNATGETPAKAVKSPR